MRKYCMRCMRQIPSGDICPSCGKIHPQQRLPHILEPGTILKERYLIGNVLGQGGFGITYIGCDLILNMRIAIKEYYPSGYANRNIDASTEIFVTNPEHNAFLQDGIEKFLNEARVLAEFYEADGVVDVRDFFKANNTAYIVMEYLDGVTLLDCIREVCLAPELMLKMMDPVLDALEKVHSRSVIHRDISPDNIMLLQNGKLKLMDFGAARQVDFNNEKSMSVILKAGFAPVEQYRSKGKLGPWTDIYALCATMYVCMTGALPETSLERVFADSIQWPSQLGVPMKPSIENVLKKGMAVRSDDRYQSIPELREAIHKALSAEEAENHGPDISGNNTKPMEKKSENLSRHVSRILHEKSQERRAIEQTMPSSSDQAGNQGKTFVIVEDDSRGDKTPTPPTPPKPPKSSKSFLSLVESYFRKMSGNTKKIIVCGIVVVIILLFALKSCSNSGKEEVSRNIPVNTPGYMVMMGDTQSILAGENSSGTVSMNVDSDNYDEKFHNYTAYCKATVGGKSYSVKLVYNLKDDEWVLNPTLSSFTKE